MKCIKVNLSSNPPSQNPKCMSHSTFNLLFLHSESVTHVISENNCGTEVRTWLESQGRGQSLRVHLLDVSWYTESMRAGHPVEITHRHKLQVHFHFTHP